MRPEDWQGWVWPVSLTDGRVPVVTQEFRDGARSSTTSHLGVDIMFPKRTGDPVQAVKHDASRMFIAPSGTKVIAAGPGKVWSAGVGAYGHYVQVDHGNVGTAGGVNTYYQHLESFARPWVKGDRVEAGTVLGVMGYSPGLDSEGLRHLHFEMWFPTTPRDPQPYLNLWRKVTGHAGGASIATIIALVVFAGILSALTYA